MTAAVNARVKREIMSLGVPLAHANYFGDEFASGAKVKATGSSTPRTLADWMASIAAIPEADGTAQYIRTAANGAVLDIKVGTTAVPDTAFAPALKVTRTMAYPGPAVDPWDGSEGLAAISGIAVGTTGNVGQPVGVIGMAKNSSTESALGQLFPDAVGIYGLGQVTGSNVGVAIGAYIEGQCSTADQMASGIQLRVSNWSATPGAYNPTGFTRLAGMWLTCGNVSDVGAGIVLGNQGAQFKVGLAFNGQVADGFTGPVADSSIRDDGSATISLDIRGSHTYGLDLVNGTYSGSQIRLKNASNIAGRNNAGDADLAVLALNSSDIVVLGGTSVAAIFMSNDVRMADGKNIKSQTTTGTKIGTATDEKLAFWNATPVVQPTAVADASGGATIDAEARTALNALLARMRTVGMVAT